MSTLLKLFTFIFFVMGFPVAAKGADTGNEHGKFEKEDHQAECERALIGERLINAKRLIDLQPRDTVEKVITKQVKVGVAGSHAVGSGTEELER